MSSTYIQAIPAPDGKIYRYRINKFDPIEGREIVFAYPLTLLGKTTSYKSNEDAMLKLLKYVELIDEDDNKIETKTVADKVPDWWTLVQLEYYTLKFNCTFLEGSDLISMIKESAMKAAVSIIDEYVKSREDEQQIPTDLSVLDKD